MTSVLRHMFQKFPRLFLFVTNQMVWQKLQKLSLIHTRPKVNRISSSSQDQTVENNFVKMFKM